MIPGSAMRHLEAITGCEVKKLGPACYGLYVTPDVALFSFKKDEKDACNELEQFNWRRVSNIVFEKQDWKCAECGSRSNGLQCHHRIFRSKWRREDGPRDVESNLTGVCQGCHESLHKEKSL